MSLFDPPDEPEPGKVGRDHPDTSRDAARNGAPAFGSERADVLEFVGMRPHGATAAECADALGRVRNQIATRFLELRERGWLERVPLPGAGLDSGHFVTRATGPSTRGIVHRLPPERENEFSRWRMDRARAGRGDG